RPYDLKKRTAIELARALQTPPTPPSRVGPAAPEGGPADPEGGSAAPGIGGHWPLARRSQLARDLDAVTLMAMEHKPDNRYASVEQFADDVRRAMEHRPIRARAQTWTYRSQQFVRRHATVV